MLTIQSLSHLGEDGWGPLPPFLPRTLSTKCLLIQDLFRLVFWRILKHSGLIIFWTQHRIVKTNIFTFVFIDSCINETGVFVPLEFIHRIIH